METKLYEFAKKWKSMYFALFVISVILLGILLILSMIFLILFNNREMIFLILFYVVLTVLMALYRMWYKKVPFALVTEKYMVVSQTPLHVYRFTRGENYRYTIIENKIIITTEKKPRKIYLNWLEQEDKIKMKQDVISFFEKKSMDGRKLATDADT